MYMRFAATFAFWVPVRNEVIYYIFSSDIYLLPKVFFRIFSLFYYKVIEKVWGSLGRSQNSTDCILSQIRISILFMIEIKLTSSSSNFLFPIYFIQTQNGFKEKSSFLPFNILSCLCLGFKVFLVRIA